MGKKKIMNNDDFAWIDKREEPVLCSVCKVSNVIISEDVHKKVKYIMGKMGRTEWACDLLGTIQNNTIRVEDIYIFEQRVTGASVERVGSEHPDSIGLLHSHHTMGSFFSHVDKAEAFANHDLVGVVDSNFNYKFLVRVKTPCGKDTELETMATIENSFIEVDLKNIHKFEPIIATRGAIYGHYDF